MVEPDAPVHRCGRGVEQPHPSTAQHEVVAERQAPQPGTLPIDLLDGEPDQQGIGFFTRLGFADKDTSPIEWAVSGGLGGRGVIPSRDNDTFGIGYYYQSIQKVLLTSVLGVGDSAQGFECFYNIAVTPASRVTLDLQVVEPSAASVPTATIFGVRVGIDF